MPGSVAVATISIAVVVILCSAAIATAPAWRAPAWVRTSRRRVSRAIDAAVPHVGRPILGAGVALAGFAATLIVIYFLGKLAHRLEPSVDVPMFAWFEQRQIGGSWDAAWGTLTKMGNRAQTQRVAVIGALVLAVLWRRRGFWIPLFALPVAYLLEKFGQMLVSHLVDRGHPPTTLGTWPSGGCARLVVVYGLVIYLFLRWRRAGRREWVAGWSLLAVLTTLEAYSRTYLLKHWFTDVVGGVIYGVLLLIVMIAAVRVLDRRPAGTHAIESSEQSPKTADPARHDGVDKRQTASYSTHFGKNANLPE